ncbi:hypothetical protein BB559_000118 [Furculomyces boomerangus]|uniref:Atg6 BARA domain-containing protein n=2 Tax=Harpellales TaxID=61421 RepID=A0A2T9Z6D3_9FUNG|nr:hypothetical protein BB559_000118 [Furculomyces boomerangus]PWA00566.1 hypothetical protein BB558_003362 [Smittium angustum]
MICKKCNKNIELIDSIKNIDDEGIQLVTSSLPKLPKSTEPAVSFISSSTFNDLPKEYKEIICDFVPRSKPNPIINESTTEFPVYSATEIVEILEADSDLNNVFFGSKALNKPVPIIQQTPKSLIPENIPDPKLSHLNKLIYNSSKTIKKNPYESSLSIKDRKNSDLSTNYPTSNASQSLKSRTYPSDDMMESFILLDQPHSKQKPGLPILINNIRNYNFKGIKPSVKSIHAVSTSPNNTIINGEWTGRKSIDDSQIFSKEDSLGTNGNEKSTKISKATNRTNDTENPMKTDLGPSAKLFVELEKCSIISHPLCTNCAEKLVQIISNKLVAVSEEYKNCVELYNMYLNMESSVNGQDKFTNADDENVDNEILKLQKQLESLQEEDMLCDKELDNLSKQLGKLDNESDNLDSKTDRILLERNELLAKLDSLNSEIEHLQALYMKNSSILFDLQQRNVYNDLFTIKIFSANGQLTTTSQSSNSPAIIGTINGFRLGRINVNNYISKLAYSDTTNLENTILLKSGEITWNEINAAWGQCLLLLSTVAKRLNFEFEKYLLIPMGSYSKIQKKPKPNSTEKSIYELYGSGDLHLGRLFQNRRFDTAMVAFLTCLNEICKFVEKHLTSTQNLNNNITSSRIPYQMKADLVGDVSIRMQFNSDETWTKALTHMLINCKWLLAFASNFGAR